MSSFSAKNNVVAVAAFFLLSCVSPTRAESVDVDTAKRAVAEALRPLNLIPILLAEDQRPGDVYKFLTWTLASKRDECFSNLPSDGPYPTKLLDSISIKDISASSFFSLSKLFSADASARLQSIAIIRFFDEQSYVLSAKALRDHLVSDCPDLRPIVNEENIAIKSPEDLRQKGALLAIFGRVVYARRRIFVGFASTADANVAATSITALLGPKINAVTVQASNASASASLGFASQNGVIVEDTSVIPVAFAPAFLPEILLAKNLGGQPKPSGVAWSAADAGGDETMRRFDALFKLEYPVK